MSDQSDGNERATVALAVAEIRHLQELTRAEFGAIGKRLDKVEGLPERIVWLEARIAAVQDGPARADGHDRILADHETRILATERARDESVRVADEDRRFHRIHWPTFLMAAIAVAVAAGPLVIK